MSGKTHQFELYVHVVGPLKALSADGVDLTPRGRKAKGLLALLALAPEHTRSRQWLQDKLWSDRGQPQGSASLRQTLAEIRRSLGSARGCIATNGDLVALDCARVRILLQQRVGPLGPFGAKETQILLEDVDIRDSEFEDWIRDQRNQFDTQHLEVETDQVSVTPSVSPFALVAPVLMSNRLKLVVTSRQADTASGHERVIADSVTDIVTRSVAELGTVDIVDLRRQDAEGLRQYAMASRNQTVLAVQSDVVESSTNRTWRLELNALDDQRILWSSGFQFPVQQAELNNPTVLRHVNQVVEEVFRNFQSNTTETEERRVATLLAHQGAAQLLRLGRANITVADHLFKRAFDIEPRGIYLAWRAYLRTYLIAELLTEDKQTVAEEAIAFMYQALELEPSNSYVACFSAQVHSIIRQSHAAAFEMAERSVQLNPANPMGWACLGIAECYLGKATAGLEHTLLARDLVGATPLRFQINALACIAATMAGDIDRSILLGEASHGLAPAFKPPMRFLSALYLLSDQQEKSQGMVDKLRVTEPNFSYDLLRDKSYPAASLQRSNLLHKLPQRQF
jgi:tetratricopeptide (TPR) repeat protein